MSSDPQQNKSAATPGSDEADPRGALPDLGRRRFLKGTLWTAAAVATGGLVYRGAFGAGTPATGLRALTLSEYTTACALADTFFPAGENPVSAAEAKVGEFIDRRCAELPSDRGKLFKLLLRAFELSPMITLGKMTRFSNASLKDRREVLDRWEHARFPKQRSAHRVLMFAVTSGYFEDDAVLKSMGWSVGCYPSQRLAGEII